MVFHFKRTYVPLRGNIIHFVKISHFYEPFFRQKVDTKRTQVLFLTTVIGKIVI